MHKHLRKKYNLESRDAFTLVEAMIAVILFAMLFGASTLIYLAGTESWNANETGLQVRQEMRKAITRISEDLRRAGTSSVVNVTSGGAAQSTIVFRTVTGVFGGVATWSGNTTTYSVGGNQLLKTVGIGTPTPAALNITSTTYQRQSATPDIVNVTIVGTKNSNRGRPFTVTGTFSVQLRNG